MAEQTADAKPVDPSGGKEAAQRPSTALDTSATRDDRRMRAARGITLAVLISMPFWVAVAVALYLLL